MIQEQQEKYYRIIREIRLKFEMVAARGSFSGGVSLPAACAPGATSINLSTSPITIRRFGQGRWNTAIGIFLQSSQKFKEPPHLTNLPSVRRLEIDARGSYCSFQARVFRFEKPLC